MIFPPKTLTFLRTLFLVPSDQIIKTIKYNKHEYTENRRLKFLKEVLHQ